MNYYGYCKDVKDRDITVLIVTGSTESVLDISQFDFDAATELILSDEPVTLELTSEDSLFTPLKQQSATVRIVNMTNGLYTDLFTPDSKDCKIYIVREANIVFRGYITPNLYSQAWEGKDTLELECISPVSYAEYVKYETIEEDALTQSWYNIIANCIKLIGGYERFYWHNTFGLSKSDDEIKIFLDAVFQNEINFFDDDEEHTPWTVNIVLEEFCKFLGISLVEYYGEMWFVNYPALGVGENKTLDFTEYNVYTGHREIKTITNANTIITENTYKESGQNASLDEVYTKFTIKNNQYVPEDDTELGSKDNLVPYFDGVTITYEDVAVATLENLFPTPEYAFVSTSCEALNHLKQHLGGTVSVRSQYDNRYVLKGATNRYTHNGFSYSLVDVHNGVFQFIFADKTITDDSYSTRGTMYRYWVKFYFQKQSKLFPDSGAVNPFTMFNPVVSAEYNTKLCFGDTYNTGVLESFWVSYYAKKVNNLYENVPDVKLKKALYIPVNKYFSQGYETMEKFLDTTMYYTFIPTPPVYKYRNTFKYVRVPNDKYYLHINFNAIFTAKDNDAWMPFESESSYNQDCEHNNKVNTKNHPYIWLRVRIGNMVVSDAPFNLFQYHNVIPDENGNLMSYGWIGPENYKGCYGWTQYSPYPTQHEITPGSGIMWADPAEKGFVLCYFQSQQDYINKTMKLCSNVNYDMDIDESEGIAFEIPDFISQGDNIEVDIMQPNTLHLDQPCSSVLITDLKIQVKRSGQQQDLADDDEEQDYIITNIEKESHVSEYEDIELKVNTQDPNRPYSYSSIMRAYYAYNFDTGAYEYSKMIPVTTMYDMGTDTIQQQEYNVIQKLYDHYSTTKVKYAANLEWNTGIWNTITERFLNKQMFINSFECDVANDNINVNLVEL